MMKFLFSLRFAINSNEELTEQEKQNRKVGDLDVEENVSVASREDGYDALGYDEQKLD